ncbi:hypothetical protein [Streptomyces sp. NPDC051211]|uniref:hypothetical protein n=1 Tax=Streptomyces sp. NPDC051211 TaxID=3154643 RepID=UPI00344F144C
MNRSLLLPARLIGPAAAALSLVVLGAGPAAAAPSVASRVGSEVRWTALPATANTVFVGQFPAGTLSIFDEAGIVAGPGCVTQAPTQVGCGPLATATRIRLAANDGNDSVTLLFPFQGPLPIPADIDGGSGQDRLRSGDRADRLTDPDGWPSPQSEATFMAEGGNDTIISRNRGYDRIDCGSGFDTVIAGPLARDAVSSNCENVIRF